MVKRLSSVRRGGLTGYKVYELLTGRIQYPVQGRYEGYGRARSGGGDDRVENYISDQMRADWEANRDAPMAFWRSGKYTIDEDLAEFGIRVSMLPWFWVSYIDPGTFQTTRTSTGCSSRTSPKAGSIRPGRSIREKECTGRPDRTFRGCSH